MLTALDLGLIYGLMALGVYLTFRVLDIADLTVDSSFTTGAAIAAVMITAGQNPFLATFCGFLGGCIAGTITGVLHVNAGIHPLLAGILTQIGLYSINLRILGKANVPLLRGVDTTLSGLRANGLLGSWVSILIFSVLLAVVTTCFNWFLSTQIGLGMRATGDNEGMARAQGVGTGTMKVFGLALSNGLVALSGALVAQYQGFADISMGIGLIVAGLASVIIGTALIGSRGVWVTSLFVVLGSIIYRVIIQLALGIEFLEANDMKLISAIIVFLALMLPRFGFLAKIRERRRARTLPPEPDITHTPEERDNDKVVL
ncbi:ABC transporter permease [Schaalia sp. ZJ405]|uniref:ABC transporter permease n=1 Tax=unclassified Schaalia TaxID=2691889 RepID=UPI0013EA4DEE|nr:MULTISPECIES: ABC transporter permease [unclassified Schaalia]QPK81219.1 ABC transporter permease [Schaalia sp. ZJ405]